MKLSYRERRRGQRGRGGAGESWGSPGKKPRGWGQGKKIRARELGGAASWEVWRRE